MSIVYINPYSFADIVKSGLVLNLDAGNPASYPHTGTTWTDLSGNGNTATLTNGPSYSGAEGGSIVFDGVNDYGSIAHSSSLSFATALTLSVWFYSNVTPSNFPILYLKGRTDDDNYNPVLHADGYYAWTGPNGRSQYAPAAGFIVGNNWYNITVSHLGGSSVALYKNGVLSTSHTFTEGSAARALGTNLSAIGINADIPRGQIRDFNGKIPIIQAYNRALSATEVTQNFNALRGRFGL